MLGKTASIQIRTPEGVSFNLPLAGPVSRGLALLIDLVATILIMIVVSIISASFPVSSRACLLSGLSSGISSSGILILFSFVLIMLYGAFLEWIWKGQTVGGFHLRVVDERGLSLTLGQIVIRNLFRLLDMLPSLFI